MSHPYEIETEHLRLRQWRPADYPVFAQMGQDAEVMRYFPAKLSRQESDAMAQRCHDLIAQRGWGMWAAEEKATGDFIGFIGLHIPAAELPFSPCVEIGWRLARAAWGRGLATEGASAALTFAFEQLSLPEVVSFTVAGQHTFGARHAKAGHAAGRMHFPAPSPSREPPLAGALPVPHMRGRWPSLSRIPEPRPAAIDPWPPEARK